MASELTPELVKNGYLQQDLACPGSPHDQRKPYVILGESPSGVICLRHGRIQGDSRESPREQLIRLGVWVLLWGYSFCQSL